MTAKSHTWSHFFLIPALLLTSLAAVITFGCFSRPLPIQRAIEIRAYIKRMTATIDKSMLLPMYDKYVENQVALIRSPVVPR